MRQLHAPSKTLTATLMALTAVLLLIAGPVARPAAADTSTTSSTSGGAPGYWLVANTGRVYQLGTTNYGDLRGTQLNRPVVGGSPTTDGRGYWLVASDGGIFSFGDARFHGSTGGITLNKPIVGMAADPVTGGYWMVASDGGVFSFNARFYGSTGGITLNKPVVGMASTPDGGGYWLVASDGGIFAFGDARFYGSTGGVTLAKPVVGMAPTVDGHGYWLVASDGGIFTFGDARFRGSTGSAHLAYPVIGMSATPSGNGYWLAASDGGIFNFGDAPFIGTSGTGGTPPIVAIMSTAYGYPFPPGATGYDVSKYQCSPYGQLPSPRAFAIVEISGNINGYYNACYPTEAAWAGPDMSAYIFMNPMPSPAPQESLSGPAGNCAATDAACQSYNFGYYWARHWVDYSRTQNVNPTLWWLDVEPNGGWSMTAAAQATNSSVIAGAVAGLRAAGVTPGIYSTNYQWNEITGNNVSFPEIALWVPGASNVGSSTPDAPSATQVCAMTPAAVDPNNFYTDYAPFAGGRTVLVQYGYGNYVPASSYDQDYACQ